ncbi:unnamed protein product [Pylaiella littoralis]
MRDSDGRFTWYSLRAHLEAAMKMATDLNLLDARKVLTDTIARGNRLVAACSDPVIVLGVFSKMLPWVHGVSQEVYEVDCADLRKVTLLARNFFTNHGGRGGGGSGGAGSGKTRGSRHHSGAGGPVHRGLPARQCVFHNACGYHGRQDPRGGHGQRPAELLWSAHRSYG